MFWEVMNMEETESKVSLKSQVFEWVKFIATVVIVYFLATHIIGFTRISGFSMNPTLKDGSIVAVNKLSSYVGKPDYKDVVVINRESKGYEIIKRVIALPGDRVSIKNGFVYVNDSTISESYTQGISEDMEEVTVPQGDVFVIGDNRDAGESLDSRDFSIGSLPIASIKGYALFSILPFYKIAK